MNLIRLIVLVMIKLFKSFSAFPIFDSLQKNTKEIKTNTCSYNAGKDWMDCHNHPGNKAEFKYWWNIVSMVFKTKLFKIIIIELWEKLIKQVNLYKCLLADKLGNFYNNQIVDFNKGCFPLITVGSTTKTMRSDFVGASCNNCRNGETTDILTIN